MTVDRPNSGYRAPLSLRNSPHRLPELWNFGADVKMVDTKAVRQAVDLQS
jgi:hypothetical protein